MRIRLNPCISKVTPDKNHKENKQLQQIQQSSQQKIEQTTLEQHICWWSFKSGDHTPKMYHNPSHIFKNPLE